MDNNYLGRELFGLCFVLFGGSYLCAYFYVYLSYRVFKKISCFRFVAVIVVDIIVFVAVVSLLLFPLSVSL